MYRFLPAVMTASFMALATSVSARDLGPDPTAVILRFDMSGGQMPRTADGPILEITADGGILLRAVRPGDPRVKAKMSKQELNDLLAELIDDLNACNINEKTAIDQALKNGAFSARQFADAPTTSLQIAVPDCRNDVSIYSVGPLAKQAPKAEMIQQMHKIQLRLRRLALDLLGV